MFIYQRGLNVIRKGSMYSQAHISLFTIYWRVWLLVIREVEKTSLGSLEALYMQFSQGL